MVLTPEIREYAAGKLDKLPKFFGRIHALKAIFSVDGSDIQAEYVAHLIKGNTVVAKAVDKDVYAAIDAAAAKLETQLRRYKDKLIEHRGKTEAEEVEAQAVEETEQEEEIA